MRIAIDLLWVKHNKSGGIESYVRNLLCGFIAVGNKHNIILIVSEDNIDSFRPFLKSNNFHLHLCPIKSCNVIETILWENFNLDKLISNLNVDFCFIPFYRKPIYTSKKNRYIVTIHDLQALHFPMYFPYIKLQWLKFSWKQCIKSAYHIVAISNFVKNDIIKQYKCNTNKITTIYNPIISNNEFIPFEELRIKYKIEANNYFYTISSLHKHKNLITLLKLIKFIKEKKDNSIPQKLIVSGIKGSDESTLFKFINDNNLQENCIFTGFVEDKEKNALIKYSNLFLFPSTFEGFGMPVIEAIKLGTNVITTKLTSIPEVSKGLCSYINDPFNINEWYSAIKTIQGKSIEYSFPEYDINVIAKEYIKMFETCINIK